MRLNTLVLVAALSVAPAASAFAQDAMMKEGMKPDPMMQKMSAADMKKMEACKAMSHDRMMKNAGCRKMMKMHPDMMKQGG